MEKVDFGQVAASYAQSRNDIPVSLFESFQIRNVQFEGKKVVDLACGTGSLTRKIKLRKAEVVGIDPSPELISEAKQINQIEYTDINYHIGTAENTGLPSDEYNIVTVMRAWHWFNRNESMKEIKRILKNKGFLIVADSGFLPPHPVVTITFNILKKYVDLKPAGSKAESKQRVNGFPVEWFEEWRLNGFNLKDFYHLDYQVDFNNDSWVSRVGSLSYLTALNENNRKQILEELKGTIDKEFGEGSLFTIPHACNVAIMKINK